MMQLNIEARKRTEAERNRKEREGAKDGSPGLVVNGVDTSS